MKSFKEFTGGTENNETAASAEELSSIKGITKKDGENIFAYFHES